MDSHLMSPAIGYQLPQLMELAGLSVAEAISKQYPDRRRVLVLCGPGNNGGDGLVAAQHLLTFGYLPSVVYPKRPSRGESKELFDGLVMRLEQYRVPFLEEPPATPEAVLSSFDLVVDAIFGFSFKGEARDPFNKFITLMGAVSSASRAEGMKVEADGSSSSSLAAVGSEGIPVVSVDIPSGWHPDEGDLSGTGFIPAMLVSLTAPKQCSLHFHGHHWLGGRFVPPALAEEYGIAPLLSLYKGSDQAVKLA